MPPVEKDLYEEHPEAAARSQEEVDRWLDEHQVTLRGDHRPRPVLQFSELNVDGKCGGNGKLAYLARDHFK